MTWNFTAMKRSLFSCGTAMPTGIPSYSTTCRSMPPISFVYKFNVLFADPAANETVTFAKQKSKIAPISTLTKHDFSKSNREGIISPISAPF
jgi:hypothetical protein